MGEPDVETPCLGPALVSISSSYARNAGWWRDVQHVGQAGLSHTHRVMSWHIIHMNLQSLVVSEGRMGKCESYLQRKMRKDLPPYEFPHRHHVKLLKLIWNTCIKVTFSKSIILNLVLSVVFAFPLTYEVSLSFWQPFMVHLNEAPPHGINMKNRSVKPWCQRQSNAKLCSSWPALTLAVKPELVGLGTDNSIHKNRLCLYVKADRLLLASRPV